MYRCENCGGDLIFDPKSQALKCKSCNTIFPVDYKRDSDIEMEEDGSMEADVFNCPNCGGQLIGASESIVDFCPYCGSQVQVKTEKINSKMPEAIVPFRITKDKCKEIYKNGVKKYIFAPGEMKSETFINRVQGVYVPYWSYFCNIKGTVNTEAVDEHRHGDYIDKSYYDFSTDVNGHAVISYDAARGLDDDLSKKAGGFDDSSIMKFTPQYLSGYYADLPDVPENEHLPEALGEVRSATIGLAQSDVHMAVVNTNDRALDVTTVPRRSAMPMYFLTWRGQGKVAYLLVNGQSGKLSAFLPIDFSKYFIASLILAIPLFLIFFFSNFTLMPSTVSVWSGLILLVAMISGVFTGKKALKKEKEVYGIDIGSAVNIKLQKHKSPMVWLIAFLITFFVIFVEAGSGVFSLLLMRAVILIAGIIFFVMSLIYSGSAIKLGHEHKEGWFSSIARGLSLSGFPALIGILLSGGLTFIDLVRDEFYYGITVYSMIISILIFINVISQYNYSVTRPLKYFEGRKGLKDHA